MSFESRASSMSPEEVAAMLIAHDELKREHAELERGNEELRRANEDLLRQVEWFKRQLFGAKSERRIVDAAQLTLGELFRAEAAVAPAIEVAAHRRQRSPSTESSAAEALRFDPSVPVEVIEVPNPELEGADLSLYDRIGEKVTERLAQRPGAYVVLRFVRPVYKRKSDGAFSCPPAPPSVLERSCADVSFLAGMLVDEFRSHLPLYRQHQRLAAAGVHLNRSTLTDLVHRTSALLEPIHRAQLESILSSQVLSMDETPIKATRKQRPPPHRGQMKTAYFWPIHGDRDEIAFPFSSSRSSALVREALKSYVGVLLSDGYRVYDTYTQKTSRIVHAQCWSHARRHFERASDAEPARAEEALRIIGAIYAKEAELRQDAALPPEKVLAFRVEHVRPLVDRFFTRVAELAQEGLLLPSNPFVKAAEYARTRRSALEVFLEHPEVPLDTNRLERQIRPIAVGRRNWLFCWTEVGAKHVGIVQGLLATCRLHGIDPYTYLVDVLQRIETHPAKDVALLTPRLWKEHFAANPLPSALHDKL